MNLITWKYSVRSTGKVTERVEIFSDVWVSSFSWSTEKEGSSS
ncbi:MAG: hypothetical protein AB8F94_02580 [Saprospiraceae bacterium]